MPSPDELAFRLIRNVNDLELHHASLDPKYECSHARVTEGTAAKKLAAGLNVVPPGKRACPYHLHHAQEEMFIVLEGEGTFRVAGEMLPVKAGDVIVAPPGKEYPHQIINTSDRPLKYLAIGTTEEPEICEYGLRQVSCGSRCCIGPPFRRHRPQQRKPRILGGRAVTPTSVSLQSDSPEMAETYNATSIHQFNNGKMLIESLDISAGESVLDVGAGTGQLGAHVASIVGPRGRVVGIDPLPARVAIAQRRCTRNFEMRIGQAEDLSQFRDSTFDVVYLNSVFHWLSDKARGLSEVFRVLKPGGRMGFNTTDPQKPHEIAQLVRQALAQEALVTDTNNSGMSYSQDALRLLVARAGFASCHCSEHTIRDQHADAESVIEWSASSQFGNFVSSLGQDDFARFRRTLVKLLEARQTTDGIQLERYLVFVTARRPG